jgi:UDP-N-acetylmuramoyl-L-alanyl-D-glutamate--2,6-diaminopimelate ligase
MRPVRLLGELARAAADLVIAVAGDRRTEIAGLAHISDKVATGDLFFCIEGFGVDGHNFAPAAVEAGAAALCVERPIGLDVPELVVSDSRQAAALIAAEFFGHPGDELLLVGVTGTNGKTTTTYLLESIFEADGRSAGLIGTIGARSCGEEVKTVCTTPDPIDLQRLLRKMRSRGLEAVALEVTSHGLVLNRVDGLHFDAAVFTNLSPEHLGFHGGMAEYFAAKRALFDATRCSQALINVDDAYGRELLTTIGMTAQTYGFARDAAIKAEGVRLSREGSEFRLVTPAGALEISSALPGLFNVSNCLAAAAAALQVGVELRAVGEGIRRVRKVPGRFELVDAGQPFMVVVDYAHSPAALEGVLTAGRRFADADGGRLICVFGCGGGTYGGKRPLMGAIATRLAQRVILTSDNPRQEDPAAIIGEIASAAPNALRIEDRGEAIATALASARANDVVVIAGKGHETEQQLADRTIPFDDRDVAVAALRRSASPMVFSP